MLKKEILTHKKEYSSLIIGLFGFMVLFLVAWPDAFLIRMVALAMSVFYIIWGLLTHHHAPKKVFLEYVVIAALGSLAIFFLTL